MRAALGRHRHGGGAIAPIRTTGDRITDRPLADAGGKGLFTKEIDEALLAGRIDLAVHSAKDLPTALPDGIVDRRLPAARRRARRLPVAARATLSRDLPAGAVVGTASLRRAALALQAAAGPPASFPCAATCETRLEKLDAGEADATLLALAGLTRLGLADRAAGILDTDDWLPAPGQGAIAITARADDARVLDAARRDRPSRHLGGACRASAPSSPCSTAPAARRSAGLPRSTASALRFRGIIVKPDGSAAHDGRAAGASARRRSARRRCRRRARPARRAGFLRRLKPMHLLVTRPRARCQRHRAAADGARPYGRRSRRCSTIVLAAPPGDLPQPAALIVTSRNGVRALRTLAAGGGLARRAAVRGRRRRRPKRRGRPASPMCRPAAAKARRSSRSCEPSLPTGRGPVLYAAARDLTARWRQQLDGRLRPADGRGLPGRAGDEPQPGALAALAAGDHRRGAVLFAADGGDLPRSRRRPARAAGACFALSAHVAGPLAGPRPRTLHVAREPDETSLLALIPRAMNRCRPAWPCAR